MLEAEFAQVTATVTASAGAVWALLKSHTKRIDLLEQQVAELKESKATRKELQVAVDRMLEANERIYKRLDDLVRLVVESRAG